MSRENKGDALHPTIFKNLGSVSKSKSKKKTVILCRRNS